MSQLALNSLPLQRTAEVPFAIYKRRQAAHARYRLYPLTVFYTVYALLVLIVAFSTTHPWTAAVFFSAGCAIWTLVEYFFHRYVLHGRFSPGKGFREQSSTSSFWLSFPTSTDAYTVPSFAFST